VCVGSGGFLPDRNHLSVEPAGSENIHVVVDHVGKAYYSSTSDKLSSTNRYVDTIGTGFCPSRFLICSYFHLETLPCCESFT
jgi:hypothetical protein